eukprot:1160429-Pelagomonas_calceolata.AAC.2
MFCDDSAITTRDLTLQGFAGRVAVENRRRRAWASRSIADNPLDLLGVGHQLFAHLCSLVHITPLYFRPTVAAGKGGHTCKWYAVIDKKNVFTH